MGFVNKTNRRTELQFYWITTLNVSGSLSAHHQEFLAVHRHWYILFSFMTVYYQERDRTLSSILLLIASGHQAALKVPMPMYG
jgi:hypothetical protein